MKPASRQVSRLRILVSELSIRSLGLGEFDVESHVRISNRSHPQITLTDPSNRSRPQITRTDPSNRSRPQITRTDPSNRSRPQITQTDPSNRSRPQITRTDPFNELLTMSYVDFDTI